MVKARWTRETSRCSPLTRLSLQIKLGEIERASQSLYGKHIISIRVWSSERIYCKTMTATKSLTSEHRSWWVKLRALLQALSCKLLTSLKLLKLMLSSRRESPDNRLRGISRLELRPQSLSPLLLRLIQDLPINSRRPSVNPSSTNRLYRRKSRWST